MNSKIFMHQSTLRYLLSKYEKYSICAHIKGNKISFYGYEIVIDNFFCSETINETDGYFFPKEKFVTYEPSDREWCEPLGIGRVGRGFKLGDIFLIDASSGYISLFPLDK
jgi:hypothetical protein